MGKPKWLTSGEPSKPKGSVDDHAAHIRKEQTLRVGIFGGVKRK